MHATAAPARPAAMLYRTTTDSPVGTLTLVASDAGLVAVLAFAASQGAGVLSGGDVLILVAVALSAGAGRR